VWVQTPNAESCTVNVPLLIAWSLPKSRMKRTGDVPGVPVSLTMIAYRIAAIVAPGPH